MPDRQASSAATVEQRDGAWFASCEKCGWLAACRNESFARELAENHPCVPGEGTSIAAHTARRRLP